MTVFTPAGWQQAAVSALTWDTLSLCCSVSLGKAQVLLATLVKKAKKAKQAAGG